MRFRIANRESRIANSLLASAGVFAISLLVYVLTLAPDLTWAHNGADGGDLIAASFTGGIAHPPGYPLYLILGRMIALLPLGNVPYRYNLFSALATASAAALLTYTSHSLAGRSRLPPPRLAMIGDMGAGLALAFAPLVWEQAVITEVYGLNVLFSAALVALSARAPCKASHVAVLVAAYSLATSHHLTLACFLPLVGVRLAQASRRLGWARTGLASLAGALAGLIPLLYLPLAARGPVVWGDPSTPAGLWWLISGALYQGYAFGLPTGDIIARLAVVAKTLMQSFTILGVAVGLSGLATATETPFLNGALATWTSLASGVACVAFAVGYLPADSKVYLIPLLVIFAAWIGQGWQLVFARVRQPALAAACVVICPLLVTARNWQTVSLSSDRTARDFVNGVVAQAPEGALVITAEDRHTFSLWVSALVERPRPDIIIVDQDLLRFDWYRAALRRDFLDLKLSEAGDVNSLIAQNAGRPVCRPNGLTPPWLTCQTNGTPFLNGALSE